MSGVNPVVLIQMLMNYHRMGESDKFELKPTDEKRYIPKDPRTFVFQKNNRLRVHRETDEEVNKRKSNLPFSTVRVAENTIRRQLAKVLKGRCGKIWIDPDLEKLAVPLETATGNSGFGVLPTGSRIKIPEGKFIRAFTYWEKVNDIDLSAFALTEDGKQEEFSWRNMFMKQGTDITFSGDQTSGYNGGSEYLDINVDLFKWNHPDYRYIVFCNNVYSGINFSDCYCKAGFMIREENPELVLPWKGERDPKTPGRVKYEDFDTEKLQPKIFDPNTVATSYQINTKSMFAYLFAIDLKTREMVWLNVSREGRTTVAGTTGMDWLKKYLTMTDILSLKDLYAMAGEIVDSPGDADILVTDAEDILRRNYGPWSCEQKFIHSWDFEKMLNLLKAG